MHFKSLVILACSLATFASAIAIDTTLGTATNELSAVGSSLVDETVIPLENLISLAVPPKQCTRKELRQIRELEGLLKRLNLSLQDMLIPEDNATVEYKSDPSACKELRDLDEKVFRAIRLFVHHSDVYNNEPGNKNKQPNL
ncbi:hypothetical protein C0993_008898 [Termitomyces sp. T159_Od127]|nr:hypothetical protein C0993_008898 [Termitomyces sp. T159_Od127]